MEKSDRQFLELVRAGLQGDSPENALFAHENVNWPAVMKQAKRQAVLGIVYEGVTLLPAECRPDRQIILQLFACTQLIEKENYKQNVALKEVVKRYQAEGLNPVLLKGQGLAQYYRIPLRRQPGDIDLFFNDQYAMANTLAKEWGMKPQPPTIYHRAFKYGKAEIENHQLYVYFYAARNRKRWDEVTRKIALTDEERLQGDGFSVLVPQPQMNVLYVFLHFMHHFLGVGVGLRQVCDWINLWQTRGDAVDKELFLWAVRTLHIERAMTALAYIAERYLGLPTDIIPLDTTSRRAKKDGEYMLADILRMGNFSHDTVMMKGFVRNRHLHNLKSYFSAFRRQLSLYRFFPSEVIAYPAYWLKSKL